MPSSGGNHGWKVEAGAEASPHPQLAISVVKLEFKSLRVETNKLLNS